MVRKLNDEVPMQKHTLNLYEGQYATLQQMFPELGAAVVIRRILQNFIDQQQTKVELPNLPKVDLNV